jgi:hypothetical protein
VSTKKALKMLAACMKCWRGSPEEAITELEAVVDDLREIIRFIEREEGLE